MIHEYIYILDYRNNTYIIVIRLIRDYIKIIHDNLTRTKNETCINSACEIARLDYFPPSQCSFDMDLTHSSYGNDDKTTFIPHTVV